MEQFRPLVITDLSAEDLEDIRFFGKLKVYAVGSITGGPASTGDNSEFTTSVDDEGLTNPKWNTRMDFRLHEPSLQNNRLYLTITLYCSRTLGDKHVGGVTVPVKPLFDTISGNAAPPQAVQYPVVRSSGGEQGFVKFSFAFGQPSPQSGPQQPVPQRPQPPQPPRTTPLPSPQPPRTAPSPPPQPPRTAPSPPPQPPLTTLPPPLQRHVLPVQQFLGTTQQEVLQVSGNSRYPRGNTSEPMYNQANNNDPSMRNQPTVAGDYQPQNPANDPAYGQANAPGNWPLSSDQQNPYDNTSGARKNDLDENNEVLDYAPEED